MLMQAAPRDGHTLRRLVMKTSALNEILDAIALARRRRT
jgi:hypothetical protein